MKAPEIASAASEERTLHYVHVARAMDWLRLGWLVVLPNRRMHHDYYNVTMEWLCDCTMVKPQ